MKKAKEIVRILTKDFSFSQKYNYVKYCLLPHGEVLNYDPVTLSIVATSRCTLSCDMCPTHSTRIPKTYPYIQDSKSDMTLETFKEIIDRYHNAIAVQVIGSGEPMLNKDFFGMVNYAAMKKMTVKTFSNGTTVAANMDNILASRLEGITISLNGHDAKEFNRMTGMPEKVYGDVYAATKRLIEERNRRHSTVRVKLSYIIDKHNYKFMSEMARISATLGADFTFFCNFLACPYEGFTAAERTLESGQEIAGEIQRVNRALPVSQRRKFDFPMLIDRQTTAFNCKSHFSQIRFDGDGNVSSCSMMLLNMGKKGNFRDRDAWNNEFFRTMRRSFLSGKRGALHAPCLWCPDNVGVVPWE